MGDSYSDPNQGGRNYSGQQRDGGRGGFRGGRGPGNRDSGGFRIRLSDNEMRAARSLQEAFNLRSTVAVLGFAIRTLAQMLEEGKLSELLEEYRSQASRSGASKRNKFDDHRSRSTDNSPGIKPNPFARPEKPQQPIPEADTSGDNDLDSQDNEKEPKDQDVNLEEETASESSSGTKDQTLKNPSQEEESMSSSSEN